MSVIKGKDIKLENPFARLPLPTLIIGGFWVFILAFGAYQGLSLPLLLGDTFRRFGMWGLLVLAMAPSIQSGTGPNFALPVGIVCGLLAQVVTIEIGFMGVQWLLVSATLAISFAVIAGFIYGKLLNAVKGSEMTIATYTGFSITYLFCIVWMAAPFRSPKMGWMLGSGIRNTIDLNTVNGSQILNNFLQIDIGGLVIPTGMLLVLFGCCLIVWIFFRTKTGVAVAAIGTNPVFAGASGLNADGGRITANIISTIFAALGIIVYSQSYGFIALYDAPLMMAFQAVAAVLVGGATARRSKIAHVLIGTLIFQGLLTNTPPVLSKTFPGTELTEIMRMVVQNGIILYALTQAKGGEK